MEVKDLFGKDLQVGQTVVYPSRPGGKGPLKLEDGKVQSINDATGEVHVQVNFGRLVKITRTERLAIV